MGGKITVLGGDLRQISLAEAFATSGYDVCIYGFDKQHIPGSLKLAENLNMALDDCRTIVFGIAPDGENHTLSSPLWSEQILIDTVLDNLHAGTHIFGGKLSPHIISLCKIKSIDYTDYTTREDFAVLNAVPTAEGALEIAMRELPCTIFASKCLVCGYGKIGKVLSRLLHSMGADVCCTARKPEDLAWIQNFGHKAIHTSSVFDMIYDYDVIFNTVPHCIFTREVLKNIPSGTLIIDLASKPGGVDYAAAQELGIKVIWALSLPGKVAPYSAGKIIKDTITNILSEL